MTEKDPIQLKSIGCPNCSIPLDNGLIPYFLNGSFLGSFDGQICSMCRFVLLSEKGHEDTVKIAYQRGFLPKSLDSNFK